MKVIVIGGGIMGAGTAYHLARKGAKVLVIERADKGRATSAGAGIICPWLDRECSDAFYQLAYRAAAYYNELVPALAEDGELDISYRKTGAMLLSSDADTLDKAEVLLRSRAGAAPDVGTISRLTPKQAQGLFPALNNEMSALHVSGGARLNGRLLAESFERASIRHGAAWQRGHADLIREGERITAVSVDGETISCDAVVVAAGAWAPELLQPLGVPLAVQPQRGQIVHLSLPGVQTSSWPVLLPAENDNYLLAFDDSRVVVGATRETGSGFDYRITADGIRDVLTEALRVAPGLAGATLLETRVGFRPMSSTSGPLLGPAPNLGGLFIANGMGATGLTLGAFSTKLLAAQILGEPASPLIEPFKI